MSFLLFLFLSLSVQSSEKRVIVEISTQTLYCLEDNIVIESMPVSTAIPNSEYITPTGTFYIIIKYKRFFSKRRQRWITNWLGFTSDGYYGIHSLPDADYEKELGKPVSTGCVRVSQKDGDRLFRWAEIGTPIVITKKWGR